MGCRSQALKPARVITRPRHSLRMAEVEEGNSPSLPEGMVEISREELKALAEQAGVNVKTTSELVKEERIKVVQGREGGREEAGRQQKKETERSRRGKRDKDIDRQAER